MKRRIRKDSVYYVIIDINNKGKEVIYGTDVVVQMGVLNSKADGLLLQKEPINVHTARTYKAFVPKGAEIVESTSSTISVTAAHISTHCVAKYGIRVDEK